MTHIMKHAALVGIIPAVFSAAMLMCIPSFAQQSTPKVVAEFKVNKGDEFKNTFSPDGMTVAHFGDAGLLLFDTTTSTDKLIIPSDTGTGLGTDVAFSPDGNQLAFELDGISTVNLNGSELTHIAPTSASTLLLSHPLYSPDGSYISVQVKQGTRNSLGLLRPDTSNQEPQVIVSG